MKENIEFWDLPIGSVFLYSFRYFNFIDYLIGTKTGTDTIKTIARSVNTNVRLSYLVWTVTGEAYPCVMKVFEDNEYNNYKKYCSEDFKKEFPEEII